MQYLLTEEEYTTFKASKSNDKDTADTNISIEETDAYKLAIKRIRSAFRGRELGLYGAEAMDGFIRVGSIEIDPDSVSDYSDDEWDELVNKLDAEFKELNEPPIILEAKGTHIIQLDFAVDQPYLECKLSKTTIRVYPKEFEKESGVDIKKFRILDNGTINELQLTAYQAREK